MTGYIIASTLQRTQLLNADGLSTWNQRLCICTKSHIMTDCRGPRTGELSKKCNIVRDRAETLHCIQIKCFAGISNAPDTINLSDPGSTSGKSVDAQPIARAAPWGVEGTTSWQLLASAWAASGHRQNAPSCTRPAHRRNCNMRRCLLLSWAA
jgi:hypothetical protein